MRGACKDCAGRHVGCHSNCERYAADVAEHNQRSAQIRKLEKDTARAKFRGILCSGRLPKVDDH